MKIILFFIFGMLSFSITNISAQQNNTEEELLQQIIASEKQGKYHTGLRLLDQFIHNFPDNYTAKAYRCTFLLNAEYPFDDIRNCLNQVSIYDPTNFLNMLNYGILYANMGEYEKSKEQFQQILEVYPDNKLAESRLYAVSLILEPENTEYLKKLRELYDSTNDLTTLNNLIKFLNDKNEFDNAKKLLELALEIDSDDPDTLTHMGVWYAKQKDYQNARRYLEDAYDKDRDNITILLNLGLLHRDLGDKYGETGYYQTSIGYYESVLRLDPDNEFAQKGIDYCNQQIKLIQNLQSLYLGISLVIISIILAVGTTIYAGYAKYRKDELLEEQESDVKKKEKLGKRLVRSKIFVVIYSGVMIISLILLLMPLLYTNFTIIEKNGTDVSNWSSTIAEVGIGIMVAVLIWVFDDSRQKKFKRQQDKIKNLVQKIDDSEIKQEKIISNQDQILQKIAKEREDRKIFAINRMRSELTNIANYLQQTTDYVNRFNKIPPMKQGAQFAPTSEDLEREFELRFQLENFKLTIDSLADNLDALVMLATNDIELHHIEKIIEISSSMRQHNVTFKAEQVHLTDTNVLQKKIKELLTDLPNPPI